MDNKFIFQRDFPPPNTAKPTKEWFREKRVAVLDWPANSTDKNPIENLLEILKRRSRKYNPSNLVELKRVIIKV